MADARKAAKKATAESHAGRALSQTGEVMARNQMLRNIIRVSFHSSVGRPPHERDGKIATDLAAAVAQRIVGQNDDEHNRRLMLFATLVLLLAGHGRPKKKTGSHPNMLMFPDSEVAASFVTVVMGPDRFLETTEHDRIEVNRVREEMQALLLQPEWSKVHSGHIALSCMTLLSMVDVSFLNFSVDLSAWINEPTPVMGRRARA